MDSSTLSRDIENPSSLNAEHMHVQDYGCDAESSGEGANNGEKSQPNRSSFPNPATLLWSSFFKIVIRLTWETPVFQ